MAQLNVLAVLIGVSVIPTASAQGNDWAAVMQLPPGTTIGIKAVRTKGLSRAPRLLCRVLHTGPDELQCTVLLRMREQSETFARTRIQEIRLEYIEGPHLLRRALIGGALAGTLFALAGASEAGPRAGALYFVYGGSIGASVGVFTGIGAHSVRQGPLIYRSPLNP